MKILGASLLNLKKFVLSLASIGGIVLMNTGLAEEKGNKHICDKILLKQSKDQASKNYLQQYQYINDTSFLRFIR